MKPRAIKPVTVLVVASLLSVSVLMLGTYDVLAETNYNMAGETVNEGYSTNPSNRNAEDATYNDMAEADQYDNTNFSASSEDVTYGTAGGGAFPGSLDSDDGTRRSYTEENTGGSPPASYIVYLMPNGDVTTEWDTVYGESNHYAAVDDPEEGGDDGSTYVETGGNNDVDRFDAEDLGDPGAGYELDIQLFAVHYKGAAQPCQFGAGIRVSGTYYPGIDENPSNGAYTNTSTSVWTENPYTSSEWTYSDIDSIILQITTNDASPDVRCTQVGLKVWVNFSASTNYELDAEITYSSVGDTGQTTGFSVFCQGYRSGAENFGIYAYDYTAIDWNLKDTIEDGSDTDYNFALTADEYDSGADEITIRILGLSESGDSVQDVVYLDILKVMRIEVGYAMDIEVSTSSAPQYGNITLRIKGYTSAEAFQVDIYNYTAADWDTNALQISDLGNSWQTTIDLNDTAHRSTQTVLIRFVDTTAETADTTQDTLHLDVVWITHYYTDPEISDYRTGNIEIEYGQTVEVWCTYLDYDNQAPSYVRVHTNASYTAMDANDSDTDYFDGKLYGKTLSGLAVGWYYYYFAVDDAESSEVTTETTTWKITVTAPSNTPANFLTSAVTQWQNGTNYQYNAQVEDAESDPITWGLEGNGTGFLGTTPNGYFCLISGTLPSMGWWYVNISADDDGDSIDVTWQNYTLTALNSAPYFITSPVTECLVNASYSYSPNATDNNTDELIYSIDDSPMETLDWLTYNVSSGALEGVPETNGSYDVNLSVTDTVGATAWQNFSIVVSLDDTETLDVLALVIALVFCFGLMLAGFKERIFFLLAGPVWIICGMVIFLPYHDLFMITAVGLGITLLFKGAYDVMHQ